MEYAFSASLMNIGIVALCGATDLLLLLAVGGLTATTMIFGWIAEVFVTKRMWAAAWLSFSAGCVPFLFVWGIITTLYAATASGAPGFVHAIFVTMFLAECSFAVNTTVFIYRVQKASNKRDAARLLEAKTRRARDNSHYYLSEALDYESVKIWLSFTAKTTLAWLLFGGTNAQSSS